MTTLDINNVARVEGTRDSDWNAEIEVVGQIENVKVPVGQGLMLANKAKMKAILAVLTNREMKKNYNRAICDAKKLGMPSEWIDRIVRLA